MHDEEHEHTELLGVLQAVAAEPDGPQVLKVMDKRGQTHVVAASDIEAGRVL
ncbi:MAG: hypothetical protein ACRDJ2_06380 [Actinomycetota bacterium]